MDGGPPTELRDPAALAGALGAKRDTSAAADSSRGQLLTVLGEFVLPRGGEAWTQTLVEALASIGVRDKAARQAIARMYERGWLERTRVGRQTRWSLSAPARRLLEVGADRIYGFGRTARAWNGSWLLVMASVPERERSIRYRMNIGLGWAGFGSLGQGTWISPWTDREQDAVDLLGPLGVAATSFVARLGELGDGAHLAAQAWDLPALRARYESFLDDTASPVDADDGTTAVRDLTTLVHRWRQFPFIDPDLPPELLPPDWPGPRAASRFAQCRAALLPPALEWWDLTEDRFDPTR